MSNEISHRLMKKRAKEQKKKLKKKDLNKLNYALTGREVMLYAHAHTHTHTHIQNTQMQNALTHMQGNIIKKYLISKPDMHCYCSFKGIVHVQPEDRPAKIKIIVVKKTKNREINTQRFNRLTQTDARNRKRYVRYDFYHQKRTMHSQRHTKTTVSGTE